MSAPFIADTYCIGSRESYRRGRINCLTHKLLNPFTQIKHLEVCPDGWNDSNASFLLDFLGTHVHLESVEIYDDGCANFDWIQSLVEAAKDNPRRYDLELNLKAAEHSNVEALGRIIGLSKSKLTVLSLS